MRRLIRLSDHRPVRRRRRPAAIVAGLLVGSSFLLACVDDDSEPAGEGTAVPATDGSAPVETPAPTDAPTTVPAPVDTPVPTTEAAGSDEYGPPVSEIPVLDDRTDPVVEPVPDGTYFSAVAEVVGEEVEMTLTQYFLCDSSTNVPDEPTVVCASGFGTLDTPAATVPLASDAAIVLATGDLSDPTRHTVSAGEFSRLLGGQDPAAGAPTGYAYTTLPFFVEVVDGNVVTASQFYLS